MTVAGPIHHFIWTDIPNEDEAAFNAWYDGEHMPDRILQIAGFLRGRRFRALSGGPRYLAHYEMAGPEVLRDDAYIRLRREPDPTSLMFIPKFRNAMRATTTAAATAGHDGAVIAAIALKGAGGGPASDDLAAAAALPGVSGVRLCRIEPELMAASATSTAGFTRASLRVPDQVPDWLLMVEGTDAAAVESARATLTPGFGEAGIIGSAVMERIFEIAAPAPGR